MQKILFIDDDTAFLMLCKLMLEDESFIVEIASKSSDALNAAASCEYDLIVTDYIMPEIDGIDTAKLLKKIYRKKNKRVNIILMSSNALDEIACQHSLESIDGYLHKPFRANEFLILARQLMNENFEKNTIQDKY